MRDDSSTWVDLDALALQSGEAERLDLCLRPPAPVISGEELRLPGGGVDARIDVSRTSSGFALRLRAETALSGTCSRCLGLAERSLRVDAREVDQTSADDEELLSPYVSEGLLDVDGWLHDAITLSLPERLLCRDECAGLCEVCGVSLNEVDPVDHRHAPPPDPRFAKLSELLD